MKQRILQTDHQHGQSGAISGLREARPEIRKDVFAQVRSANKRVRETVFEPGLGAQLKLYEHLEDLAAALSDLQNACRQPDGGIDVQSARELLSACGQVLRQAIEVQRGLEELVARRLASHGSDFEYPVPFTGRAGHRSFSGGTVTCEG